MYVLFFTRAKRSICISEILGLVYENIKVDKLFMNIYFYKERSFLISSCFLYLMSPKY